MTLTALLIYVAIAALVLTAVTKFVFKKDKSVLMSYLQNFTGSLFVFSGWVKAVDPLGTAYKMEDYFNEFFYTVDGTAFSFLGSLFTAMHDYSLVFSIVMIIFEIVLGLMLILGHKPKLTAWLFFILVLFFTALTGFTFLTGYVPNGVNFFNFSEWGPYVESNMRVTDCGCFGDFIVLEPYTSFLKDVALMIPAIIFLIGYKKMHTLFSSASRNLAVIISAIGLLIYCFSNFNWDLPHADFRPFKVGADIASIRNAEIEASSDVQVIAYKVKNNNTGKTEEIPYAQYISLFSDGEYRKEDGWEVVEQVLTEPSMKETKISEFFIEDFESNDVNDNYLANENFRLMIVSYKLPTSDILTKQRTVTDTIFNLDTVLVDGEEPQILKTVQTVNSSTEDYKDYVWDAEFLETYNTIVKPMALAAKKDDNVEMAVVTGGATLPMVIDFANEMEMPVDYEKADELLLKTIVRSNPGIVLWKDGKILNKWHINKVPTYEEIKSQYMK